MPYYIRKTKKKEKPLSGVKVKRKTDLVKKLDKVFSEYIRLKHSNNNGYCRCISCGKIHYWKEIQNGHYMSRRYMSTRFDENNCRPQCVACNIFNQGNAQMYRRGLIAEIGEKAVDMVEIRARTETKRYCDFELNALIEYYSKETKALKMGKGIK